MKNALVYLWQHQVIFWSLASAAYLAIGLLIGLRLYWKYCRHQYLKHGWRGGKFEYCHSCWCDPIDVGGGFYLAGVYTSPFLWPVTLAVILISLPIMILIGIFKRVERRACWDGKTIEGAHPTAKPVETVEEELRRRSGNGPDIEIL